MTQATLRVEARRRGLPNPIRFYHIRGHYPGAILIFRLGGGSMGYKGFPDY